MRAADSAMSGCPLSARHHHGHREPRRHHRGVPASLRVAGGAQVQPLDAHRFVLRLGVTRAFLFGVRSALDAFGSFYELC